MSFVENKSLLETATIEEKQQYLSRIFDMCVEISNVISLMREVGEDKHIVEMLEKTAIDILEHIQEDVHINEKEFLMRGLKNNASEEDIKKYMDFFELKVEEL